MVTSALVARTYELRRPESKIEWEAFHALRIAELFRDGVAYNRHHPHDFEVPENFPFIFKLDNQCIGTVRLDLFGERNCIIRNIAILRTLQGRGHGTEFVARCEEYVWRKHGVSKIFLNANPNAIGFYRKLGYGHEEWDDPAGAREGFAKECLPMTKRLV